MSRWVYRPKRARLLTQGIMIDPETKMRLGGSDSRQDGAAIGY